MADEIEDKKPELEDTKPSENPDNEDKEQEIPDPINPDEDKEPSGGEENPDNPDEDKDPENPSDGNNEEIPEEEPLFPDPAKRIPDKEPPKPLNNFFLPKKAGLNPYFSYMGENKNNQNEQSMADSLIVEYIQQFGMKVVYIARTPNNIDTVYGESVGSNFERSFEIEMMMQDYTAGFDGRDGVMAFGYNMHDSITMECSFSRINSELEKLKLSDRDSAFPQPGDLLYLPMYKTMLEIRFVDSKMPNLPTGIQVLYSFTCHMYNPNSETFSTDIPDIDIINEFEKIYTETSEPEDIQKEADTYIIPEPNAWASLLKQS